MASRLTKILGMAAITALSFGKPDAVYAPELPEEVKKQRTEYFFRFFEKKKKREKELAKYAQFIGKPLIDKILSESGK